MRFSPQVIVVPYADVADEFARRIGSMAREAVRERGGFSIALSGGSIAPALLPTLAAADISWESVSFFWIDERAVPPESPESNSGSALKLLAETPAARAKFFPMATHADLEFSARAYAATLVSELGTPPILDVVVLGVGEDGHVASLFPGHHYPSGAWVAAELHSPKPPSRRLTLTYDTLSAARQTCIVALGAKKAPIVRWLVQQTAIMPVARVVSSSANVSILLDDGAASLLGR